MTNEKEYKEGSERREDKNITYIERQERTNGMRQNMKENGGCLKREDGKGGKVREEGSGRRKGK